MPKIYDCAQGSPEWVALRMGIPTASCFHKIITPSKGVVSAQSIDYAYRLVAERLLNIPAESIDGIEYMERGKDLEQYAAAQYSLVYDVGIRKIGFITTDDGRVGASPDRLIDGVNAGVEIKCPAAHTHIRYMVDGIGNDYRTQIQGQLWVCDLDYVDFYSYHPLMPPVILREHRNDEYIARLSSAITEFCDIIDEMTEKASSYGIYERAAGLVTAVDSAYKGISSELARGDTQPIADAAESRPQVLPSPAVGALAGMTPDQIRNVPRMIYSMMRDANGASERRNIYVENSSRLDEIYAWALHHPAGSDAIGFIDAIRDEISALPSDVNPFG